MNKLYIGTSGYSYKEWLGKFYPKHLPEKDWLSYFSQHFNTVEINATSYHQFPKELYKQWADQTAFFAFSIKVSRYITHIKRLQDIEEEVKKQLEEASGLGDKLAVLLWQFSESFQASEENKERVKTLVHLLPQHIKHALEFRNETWFTPTLHTLLQDIPNITVVMNDTTIFPVTQAVFGTFIYIRLHGPTTLYNSSYTDEQLSMWAGKIKKFLETMDVYCYFNNDMNGYAITNAKKLQDLIGS